MPDISNETLLSKCVDDVIDLAISNVNAAGLPFAAIIVNRDTEVIGKGVNQVSSHMDCTAHAEIQAIREASQNEKSFSLKGMALIASGEPCALCYMAIRMAEIETIIIVSDRYEAERYGFDYLWTYKYLNTNLFDKLNVVVLDSDRKLLPFQLARVDLNR